jgi:hypothetical protein
MLVLLSRKVSEWGGFQWHVVQTKFYETPYSITLTLINRARKTLFSPDPRSISVFDI